jgi:hypothetical protein
MTPETPESPVQAPVPGAAPAPGFPAVTQQPAQQKETPVPDDPSSRAAVLEAELAKIRSEAVAGAKTLFRVLAPHESFTHGGITVTREPTPVPERSAGALMTAASEAGVKIEEAS